MEVGPRAVSGRVHCRWFKFCHNVFGTNWVLYLRIFNCLLLLFDFLFLV